MPTAQIERSPPNLVSRLSELWPDGVPDPPLMLPEDEVAAGTMLHVWVGTYESGSDCLLVRACDLDSDRLRILGSTNRARAQAMHDMARETQIATWMNLRLAPIRKIALRTIPCL